MPFVRTSRVKSTLFPPAASTVRSVIVNRHDCSRRGFGISVILTLITWGCGGPRNTPVNVNTAQETLKTTLDKWKAGSKPDELQSGTPKIVAQDMDWSGGAELVSYEILGDSKPMDANLKAQVKLNLRKDGKDTEKTVTYLVGTSPVLTVFRDMMQ